MSVTLSAGGVVWGGPSHNKAVSSPWDVNGSQSNKPGAMKLETFIYSPLRFLPLKKNLTDRKNDNEGLGELNP